MPGKKVGTDAEPVDRELLKHLRALGLAGVEEYRQWCAENGFSRKLNKHWKKRCRERFHAERAVARRRLAQRKREKKDPAATLQEICNGRLGEGDVTHSYLSRLCQAIRPNQRSRGDPQFNRRSLQRTLVYLHSCRAKLFDDSPALPELGRLPGNSFIEAAALVSAYSRSWLRPLEDWKPRSHNAGRQFASLVRHLFVAYEMPAFFDAVWFAGRSDPAARERGWYLHVGRGHNIRRCDLPLAYTKRMAHHFMRAPRELNVRQALRWGQVLGLGGGERLAAAVVATQLGERFAHDDFWATVVRWLIRHPMLDLGQVGPIVDYLQHQKFGAWPEAAQQARPLEPNLTMKGRSPQSLLRRVRQWHQALASHRVADARQWGPSGIEGFEFREGSQRNGTARVWTIRELLSGTALITEGRKMKHCVASYADSCARGICSIWSLEVESAQGREKSLTVEVRNRQRIICQARGKTNRMPQEKERHILRRWAAQAGLTLIGRV